MNTSIGEIADILGMDIDEGKRAYRIANLLTDSRSLFDAAASIFFAISTPATDATRFMRGLYDRGVRCFVADSVPVDMQGLPEAVILTVDDPLGALQKVAERRGGAGGEIVAITGSKGKTTLKELMYQVLSPVRKISRSPRSYNSQIGVPLSMWEITPDTELTLIEAGISRSGEMARIARCISPDTVIITGIDNEHDDGFPSRAAKVGEKVSLASAESVKKLIYCMDDGDIAEAVSLLPERVERFGWTLNKNLPTDAAKVVFTIPESSEGQSAGLTFTHKAIKGRIRINLPEEADIRNFCTLITFLIADGFGAKEIEELMTGVHPVETRLSVTDGVNGCNVIYDAYPSDLSSLAPALDFLMRRCTQDQQPLVIITDPEKSESSYEEMFVKMADLFSHRGINHIIGIGPEFTKYAGLFGAGGRFFRSVPEAQDSLKNDLPTKSCILLKGSEDYPLTHIRELLEVRTHETVLEVNLDAMIRNYNYFRSRLPSSTGLIAMVKASGYGAGSYEIAKTLQDAGAAYLAVAVLDEGIDLRRQGIVMPIMVMNPRVADYGQMFENHLEPEIYTRAMLDDVMTYAEQNGIKDYPIHIKLDTGMHRMGFIEAELPELMERIGETEAVRISSVFSHLATADMPDMNDYTEMQLATFERCSSYMLSHCGYPFKRHVLNSAGILRFPQYHYDMARLGIGLYGVNTLPPEMEKPLSTVSTLKTCIINLRKWKAGTTVGYARRGRLQRDSVVATIPIGYADGMNRHFGNGAIKVLVNGREAPTIGNICMDACMIDVTGIDCREGDTVEIFGNNMPVSRLSDALDTIPYEILTSVSPRVKRVYYRE